MQSVPYLPPREYVLAQVARGALLWLLVRLLITLMAATVSPPTAHFLSLPAVIAAAIVVLVGFLARVDSRIMREPIFHGNLGIPALLTPVLAAATAAALELTIRLVT